MKERPILFSVAMVRAILEGRKTQTRRVVKPQPELGRAFWGGALDDVNVFRTRNKTGGWHHCDPITFAEIYSPYGQPGDRLWVRETFWGDATDRSFKWYVNDIFTPDRQRDHCKLIGSIYMPRKLSRITLEVTAVRVERLQDISADDARAEGIRQPRNGETWSDLHDVAEYRTLWESINGPGSWDANPWVWVVEFKRVESQTDPRTAEVFFRDHKGTLQESMRTACAVRSKRELESIVHERHGAGEVVVENYGKDERIGWDTQVVLLDGRAVGFLSGALLEPQGGGAGL